MKKVIICFFVSFLLTCKSNNIEPNVVITNQNANGIILFSTENRNIYSLAQIGKDIQDLIAFNLIEKGYQIYLINNLSNIKIKPETFEQKSPISPNSYYSGEFVIKSENVIQLLKNEEFKNLISNHNVKYLVQASVSIYANESIKDPKSSIMIFLKIYDTEGKIISMGTSGSYNLEINDLYSGDFLQKNISMIVSKVFKAINEEKK